MDYDWVMYMDEFGEKIHDSFRKQLSIQLFEKGDNTGIKNFKKYNFQLMVGMIPLQIKIEEYVVHASVQFITPTSFSFPIRINWMTKQINESIESLHESNIEGKEIEFNWGENFPLEHIKEHISPYRNTKSTKNGYKFDVEYYYTLIPDVELELYFEGNLVDAEITEINEILKNFKENWNSIRKGKEIESISEIGREEDHYTIVMDIGLKNTIRLISKLLEKINDRFGNKLELVKIK